MQRIAIISGRTLPMPYDTEQKCLLRSTEGLSWHAVYVLNKRKLKYKAHQLQRCKWEICFKMFFVRLFIMFPATIMLSARINISNTSQVNK